MAPDAAFVAADAGDALVNYQQIQNESCASTRYQDSRMKRTKPEKVDVAASVTQPQPSQ